MFLYPSLGCTCCILTATTPSTLTPTYEVSRETSPQLSRKNSRTLACSPLEEPRETVIRFQLESEVKAKFDPSLVRAHPDAGSTLIYGSSPEVDQVDDEELNKLGRLYFKVR